MIPHRARHVTLILALLSIVAVTAGQPLSTDRDVYEQIGRRGIDLDCSDIHCFRPLVPLILEHLPGPSLLRWRAYAVITSTAAAVAVARLAMVLGAPAHAAVLVMWIAAFGYGPLQAIFDPYTADPLMYFLGPVMISQLLQDRLAKATLVGCVGVLAKEFAAAPLWIATLLAALERKWDKTVRVLVNAVAATLVWFTLQTVLLTLYNYRYGQNASVDLLGGGYFRYWVQALGVRTAAISLFTAFGALYILFAAGMFRVDRRQRLLVLACLPALAAFGYVQQPDRALWNFHFIVIPIAVTVLSELSAALCWSFVACYGIANLRLGPQPELFSIVRGVTLTISIVIAVLAASRRAPKAVHSGEAGRA